MITNSTIGHRAGLRPYRFPPERDAVFADPSFPHREELLQFIWEQGLFRSEGLRTVEGAPVEVLRAGARQTNSGPDLSDAVVRIDGQLWAGTVEVHVRSSEWYAHGHHCDAAYDNVILHVVWAHDAEVRTSAGNAPPTVVLRDRVEGHRLASFERLLRSRGWVPCAGGLSGVAATTREQALEAALVDRIANKAAQVSALHARLGNDPLNTCYHLLLRAFGGAVNAEACSILAHALPVRSLLKVRDDDVRVEALLFGQAGLLPSDPVDAHPRSLLREHALLSRLHGLVPVPRAAWKFGRLRPSGFPTVRLAQFARFFAEHGDRLVASVLEGDVDALRRRFAQGTGPYWRDHYRFDQRSREDPKQMGRDAVDHVLINAVVPLRAALVGGGAQAAVELLRSLPPERNAIVAGWAKAGLPVKDAAGSQALLQLRTVKCGQRACLTCVIGKELLSSPWP